MKHATYDFNQDQTLSHTQPKSKTKTPISSMNPRVIHVPTNYPM